MNLVRRIAGFALLPLMSAVASLVLLPMISGFDGAAGWSSIALGQSVGALISIVAGLAWPVIGAQQVIGLNTASSRAKLFLVSIWSRGLIILAGIIILAPILWALAPGGHGWSTVLFMLGTSLNALTASWYFAGTGRPKMLVLNEGVPRLAGYIVAIAAMAISHSVLSYAVVFSVFSMLPVLLNLWHIVHGSGAGAISWHNVLEVYRGQLTGGVSRIAMSAHAYAPNVLISALVPSALPVFSALDSIYKAGANAVTFLPSALIEWSQPGNRMFARRRMRISLGLISGVGVLMALVWAAVGATMMDFFFQGAVTFSWGTIQIVGLSWALILFQTAFQLLVMVPLGYESVVFRVEMIYSVLGLIALVLLVPFAGPTAGFLTYGSASGCKLVTLVLYFARNRRVG